MRPNFGIGKHCNIIVEALQSTISTFSNPLCEASRKNKSDASLQNFLATFAALWGKFLLTFWTCLLILCDNPVIPPRSTTMSTTKLARQNLQDIKFYHLRAERRRQSPSSLSLYLSLSLSLRPPLISRHGSAAKNVDIFHSENWVTNPERGGKSFPQAAERQLNCGWPRLRCRRYASESQPRRLKQTCVGGPLKNKARRHSRCSPTSKSSLITRRIKQIMKMKPQHSRRRERVQPVQQRRINIHCVQKFVSAGHEGGGRREAAAPRIDPFLFLRDGYSRRSATATCLPIGKRALVLWEACTSRNASRPCK